MREVRTSMGGGTPSHGRWSTVRSGRSVLQNPIGDSVQSFRGHGLLNAAVFGGGAGWAMLEEMVQAGQFGGLKILVAAVLQGFLDFIEILPRRDLKILLTIEGHDRTHRLLLCGDVG